MRAIILFLSIIVLQNGCTSQRPPVTEYPRVASYAVLTTEKTRLGDALAPMIREHPDASGFKLLTHGQDAFLMRIAAVEAAQKTVDLQYFSTRDDTTGKLLLAALLRAADRGVRIRLLVDDWNLDGFRKGVAALNQHKNISIRAFNPFATRDESVLAEAGSLFSFFDHITRRMHNKALVADNQLAIMGGRNLGDEYFGSSQDINFRDVDVLVAGPVTQKISANFDRYWNSAEAYPIEALSLPAVDAQSTETLRQSLADNWQQALHGTDGQKLKATSTLLQDVKRKRLSFFWAPADLAADSPNKVDMPVDKAVSKPEEQIAKLVKGAQHEFTIISPYFVPREDGVKWLTRLVRRGIKVRVLTNSLASTDMVPAEAGYSHYREQLVAGGVELYELKPVPPEPQLRQMFKKSSAQHGLHAKIYMIDRKDVVIGSFNMDPRSVHINTEQVLVIHSHDLAEQVVQLFDHIASPERSYRVVCACAMGKDQPSLIPHSSIVWVTEENGKKTYYDFSPQAGFWRRVFNGLFSVPVLEGQL